MEKHLNFQQTNILLYDFNDMVKKMYNYLQYYLKSYIQIIEHVLLSGNYNYRFEKYGTVKFI